MSDLINTFKQYKTLNRVGFQKLHDKKTANDFYIYSDNILESIDILGLVVRFSRHLNLLGVFYEPIDQPIYVFEEKEGSKNIFIKICGSYNNWDLPEEVAEIVSHIDKPDFVVVDGEFKPVFVGETTGTANVGNSQWQREGRKIRPAQKHIPFVYQTYYSGTDRSRGGKPQVREPTSLQVINHVIYCLRYASPSFVIYYPSEYDLIIGRNRANRGRSYFADYISVILLNNLDPRYILPKNLLEKKILEHMFEYLNDSLNKGRNNLFNFERLRIEKDFPNIPKMNLFTTNKKDFIKFTVKRINGGGMNKRFNILDWDFSSLPTWGRYYNKLKLIKGILKSNIIIKSYRPRSKIGIVQDTPKLIRLFSKRYKLSGSQISRKLNKDLPTIVFPARVFKGKDKVLAGDPESGEIVAFAELFSKNLYNQKAMNFLIYAHVTPPNGYPILERLKMVSGDESAKLFKAIRKYADLFIFNEQIILW